VLDQQKPMRSSLVFGGGPANPNTQSAIGESGRDGRLTAEQILHTWRIDADLVTLSACETGLGKYSGGEGYLGFSQAFFLAGAHSLIVSLWLVDDTSTALLMTRFYENLMGSRPQHNPMPKTEALAEAKRWLRNLSAQEIEHTTAALSRGQSTEQTRGRRVQQPTPPSVATEMRSYAHPFYWAGFILIGDPN
jgi:CHAT domain-containing protein